MITAETATNMNLPTNPAQLRLTRRLAAYWRVTIDNPPIDVMAPQDSRAAAAPSAARHQGARSQHSSYGAGPPRSRQPRPRPRAQGTALSDRLNPTISGAPITKASSSLPINAIVTR